MTWKSLLTTALVGTQRRPLNLEDSVEPFRNLVAQLEQQEPERALLALAGAMTLYQRAGQSAPIDTTPLLDPCEGDELPPCSTHAGLILQQILLMPMYTPHLQEWLEAAARSGQRVIEEYLPRFLTAFERRANLPEHFYDVLGKRGRWLAQQNPAWVYAVLPASDAEWELASFPARIEYLRSLRARAPVRGRALVELVWKRENADNRAALVRTLETGLNPDDETFLEAALDDRASSVSLHAAAVLANLQGAAYQQRMIQRANEFIDIHWQKHLLSRKLVIDASLPKVCDESMIRDGINPKPSTDSQLDTRAYWLSSIMGKLPLSYWLNGDWSPVDLVEAANETDDKIKGSLHSVLAKLAIREHHDALALALFENEGVIDHFKSAALSAMSPAVFNKYALKALEQERNSKGDGKIFQILSLSHVPYGWSPALTHAFLTTIAALVPQKNAAEVVAIAQAVREAAMTMVPDYVDELRALANAENKSKPTWTNVVKQAVSTLEFRWNMLKEFAR
jgi:hypothetical protein